MRVLPVCKQKQTKSLGRIDYLMVLCESVTIFSSSQGMLFPSCCLPYFLPPYISSLILLGLYLNVYMIVVGNKLGFDTLDYLGRDVENKLAFVF